MTEVAVDAYDTLKVRDIAVRINAHLRRFEADPAVNVEDRVYQTKRYYNASAWPSGRYVSVRYVCYQHASNLTKAEARDFLRKLDGGFIGTHYAAARRPNG